MVRMVGYWLVFLAVSRFWWVGLPAAEADIHLSTPLAASVGETQVWYLSFNFPESQSISSLSIENGDLDSWSFQSQKINSLNRSERVAIQAVALKPGELQPRVLLSYQNGNEKIQTIIQGKTVSIASVEDRLSVKIVSFSEKVETNQPGWLNVLVENQSPFRTNVSLQVEIPEANSQTQPVALTLKPGERVYQKILLNVSQDVTPILMVTFQWTNHRQEDHSASIQIPSQPIVRQSASWDLPALTNLLNILIGGAISLAASLATLEFRRRSDLKNQYQKDRRQVESLLRMVFLNITQAYKDSRQVNTKHLDKLLLNNNLFSILGGHTIEKAAQGLWLAVQSYNSAYDTAHFTEQNLRLKEAINIYETAWKAYLNPPPKPKSNWPFTTKQNP